MEEQKHKELCSGANKRAAEWLIKFHTADTNSGEDKDYCAPAHNIYSCKCSCGEELDYTVTDGRYLQVNSSHRCNGKSTKAMDGGCIRRKPTALICQPKYVEDAIKIIMSDET